MTLPPPPRPSLRILLRLALLLVCLACGDDRALAHAALLETTPADGAALAAAPAAATFRFNEPVSVAAVGLVGPDGATVDLAARTDGPLVTVPLPALPAGGFALTVRVVSEDGHPVASTLVFTVGPVDAAAAPPVAAVTDDPARAAAAWLARFALAAGLLIGVGGAVVAVLADPAAPPAGLMVRRLPSLGAMAAVAAVGLTGADALGLPLAALVGPAMARTWAAGAATSALPAAILALLAAAGALLALAAPSPVRRPLAVAALAATAAAFAASGHAATAEPRWLARGTVAAHAGLAALWLGALPALHRSLGDAAAPAGRRLLAAFAVAGPAGVGALATAGVTLAVLQGAVTAEALVGTAYGQVLLVKLAVVAGLLGLAAVNRWRFADAAGRDPAARVGLRRLVAVEIALAVLVLAVLSGWRFTPPPRALAAAPVTATLADPTLPATEAAAATVAVAPGRAGPVALALVLPPTPDGAPPLEVAVLLAQPEAGIAAIRRPAVRDGDRWRVPDLVLPVAGRWTVEVRVLVTAFEERRLAGAFTLR
ncbi:copper resistance protein CopC [Mongoliimonas terrestris]|uniref:copper resistance CopC/CopD family protein n=1 Tax=Mongoliimonas terrestris TaxID=1709001 RepID=UPI00094965AC|nr:copper resistance protein CopC [Mongoliimonas terrestris]